MNDLGVHSQVSCQGMNLQTLQRGTQLSDIVPKTTTTVKGAQPPVIIQNADGTQTHILQIPHEASEEKESSFDAGTVMFIIHIKFLNI